MYIGFVHSDTRRVRQELERNYQIFLSRGPELWLELGPELAELLVRPIGGEEAAVDTPPDRELDWLDGSYCRDEAEQMARGQRSASEQHAIRTKICLIQQGPNRWRQQSTNNALCRTLLRRCRAMVWSESIIINS